MDIQMLNRRELQALCKLNKIPANITNLAMINALSSLHIVVGIEDIMKPSESLETTESSVESPARTEIMSPRIPRTSYRTSTRQNRPVQEEAESVQNVIRTTRRGVRQIAGDVGDGNTATVPKTPAAASTRRRAPAASARKNMETQLNEESMDQEKKCVPLTPAAAVPTSRRKGPAATTTQRANLKEDSMYGRTYSTRRSARLTEVKVAEPSSVKKESKEHEKTDSSSTQRFKEMLDEGSDGFNAVAEDSSLSVGIECTSEYLEPEKEKTAKNDIFENMGSNNMEIDVIPSDTQNPIELNKLENVENIDRDMSSEDTITEVTDKTDIFENIASENENLSEDSKVKTVEKFSSPEDMASIEVAATRTENLSDTLKQENFGAFEDMDSDEKQSAVVMENAVLENNVLCPREDLEIEFADEEMSNESVDGSITKDVEMKTKKENEKLKKGLKDASLRQLTKMLKNKLQISNSINTNAEEAENAATRAALKTLSSNSLAETQVGN